MERTLLVVLIAVLLGGVAEVRAQQAIQDSDITLSGYQSTGPNMGTARVGDILTCTGVSNPPPHIFNMTLTGITGIITTTSQSVSVTLQAPPATGTLRCTLYNLVGGVDRAALQTYNITVTAATTVSPPTTRGGQDQVHFSSLLLAATLLGATLLV